MTQTAVITGGSGFIGSNLARKLLHLGFNVRIIDNFRTSSRRQLIDLDLQIEDFDLSDKNLAQNKVFENADIIFHLAADVDNRFAWMRPNELITNNITATLNVGLAARNFGVGKIIYSSTGTIYGDNQNPPFVESQENSYQSSLYGATKYAGEGILGVISTHFDIKIRVFRFVGVLGPGYTHGHIFDFVKSLMENSKYLKVLGNGNQKKSYMHVNDVLDALVLENHSSFNFEVFNLGRKDFSTVKDSVKWISEVMNISPEVSYGTEAQGWVGDNPNLWLETSKIEKLGWKPKFDIEMSVKDTTNWLISNSWVFG